MNLSPAVTELIRALCCMPGIGPKSAQRIAFHLLERDRHGGELMTDALKFALENVGHCSCCRMLTEQDICDVCSSEKRDSSLLCVVESPADVAALESSASYSGRYFVLNGRLSPLDGIGPEDIGLDVLQTRLQDDQLKEVILATNPTLEGEATASYIAMMVEKRALACSRIAYGVSVGGELEYADGSTLSHALSGRRPV
ncbi:recombination mediator RecR [Pelagibaculum spongiae]|uniref:Recombination protein RecR n=1 Tax=Pelagibaculum spongiae TaxID=2080658 RepID=A0A2V1GXS8_9GAMM|nr:recombination mediator RecR [Pelagibaculum spongiae]PVZ64977.1 recombination protein RecR [Pelagibaculum spongiae]